MEGKISDSNPAVVLKGLMWRYGLPDYELRLLRELQKQQQSSRFCDTLLEAEGISVPTHGCVLAALSPYLSQALSASPPAGHKQRRPVQLQAVGGQTLIKLVGLLYSGYLEGEGKRELEEVMDAACHLGIGPLVEGWRERGRERKAWRSRCSEVGMQTEAGVRGTRDIEVQTTDDEAPLEVRVFVDTGTQTVDSDICTPLLAAFPAPSPETSLPPMNPSCDECPQSLSHQNVTRTSYETSLPRSQAMVNIGTTFRTLIGNSESEGVATDDVTTDDSDQPMAQEDWTYPEPSEDLESWMEIEGIKAKQPASTWTTGGGGEGVVGRKSLSRVQQQMEAVETLTSIKVTLRREARGEEWQVVSDQEGPQRRPSVAALDKPTSDYDACRHSPNPGPQLTVPPPPVEESDEQIERLLEDIMMGLNILPPRVLEEDYHQPHQDRGEAPACTNPDCNTRHRERRGSVGSECHMCSHGYMEGGDDMSSTETAFHPITCSHYATGITHPVTRSLPPETHHHFLSLPHPTPPSTPHQHPDSHPNQCFPQWNDPNQASSVPPSAIDCVQELHPPACKDLHFPEVLSETHSSQPGVLPSWEELHLPRCISPISEPSPSKKTKAFSPKSLVKKPSLCRTSPSVSEQKTITECSRTATSPEPQTCRQQLPRCISPIHSEPSPSLANHYHPATPRIHRVPQSPLAWPPWLSPTPRVLQYPLCLMVQPTEACPTTLEDPESPCTAKKCPSHLWGYSSPIQMNSEDGVGSTRTGSTSEEEKKRRVTTIEPCLGKHETGGEEKDDGKSKGNGEQDDRFLSGDGEELAHRREYPCKAKRRMSRLWSSSNSMQSNSEDGVREFPEPRMKRRRVRAKTRERKKIKVTAMVPCFEKQETGGEEKDDRKSTGNEEQDATRLKSEPQDPEPLEPRRKRSGVRKRAVPSRFLSGGDELIHRTRGRFNMSASSVGLSSSGNVRVVRNQKAALITERRTRSSSVELNQGSTEEPQRKENAMTPEAKPSVRQTLSRVVGIANVEIPKRKRGRPRKIRPGDQEVPQPSCSVPTTVSRDGEGVEHRRRGMVLERPDKPNRNPRKRVRRVDVEEANRSVAEDGTKKTSSPESFGEKPSLRSTSPSVSEQKTITECPRSVTSPEPQPCGQQLPTSNPEEPVGTQLEREEARRPPAADKVASTEQTCNVTLTRFQELLKNRTRKLDVNKEKKQPNAKEKDLGRVEGSLEPNEKASSCRESTRGINPGVLQSLDSPQKVNPTDLHLNESHNEIIPTAQLSKLSEEIDGGHNEDYECQDHNNNVKLEAWEKVKEKDEDGETVTAVLETLECVEEGRSMMEQQDTVIELVSYEEMKVDVVEVFPQMCSYTAVEEVSGEEEAEEIDVGGEGEGNFEMDQFKKDLPIVHPDTAACIQSDMARQVDMERCTETVEGLSHDHNHLPQRNKMAVSDVNFQTPKKGRTKNIFRVALGSAGSCEEEDVEVDILGCSPYIRPLAWGARFAVPEPTSEDEEEENEIDVTGD